MKQHRGGRPLTTAGVLLKLTEHCYPDGDCLLWAGAVCSNGLPSVMWQRRRYNARRLLLELRGTPVSATQAVWTTCNDRLCMNEAHFRVGSRGDLVRWMSSQGRLSSGATHSMRLAAAVAHRARVSLTRPGELQAMLASGMSYDAIGRAVGVSGQRVRDVMSRAAALGLTAPHREAA